METTSWTEDHSQAIAEVAPPVAEVSEIELDRVWATVRATAPAAGSVRPLRRTRVVVGAVVAAATLTVGGVAAAVGFSAHTGRYPSDAEDLRLGGPGEYLDPAADDYGTVITELTGDIPFPSDVAREIVRQALVADGRRDEPGTGSVSTGAMRAWTAQGAICAWANEWAAATTAGDSAARTQATGMLDEASTWPAVTDIDPKQTIEYREITLVDPKTGKTSKRTVPDNTEFGFLPLVQATAHGDDVDAMGEVFVDWVFCEAELMTDFPQALPGR